jgi:PepSY-associated TM region
MRFDWRRVLIYTHRWLGIAGCVVFLVWFASGVVMVYARMPRLTAEERLVRIAPVDVTRLRVRPAEAAAAADVTPERLRISMLGDRPVYRFLEEGYWTTAFADTGEPLRSLKRETALEIARRFAPEHASTATYAAYLEQPDQWTIDGGLPRFLPLHRISLGDAAATNLYVSDRTGEPVMKTTSRGRFWGYMGAVLHWTYFTPFRLQPELWRWSIIYAALIGCVMCLSGLVVGIWRFSGSARYRLKRVPSHSPYAGMLWWHHYAGLLFGVFSFTWALSGALSLTPWDWAPSSSPSAQHVAAVMGGPLRLQDVTIPRVRAAASVIASEFTPKEFEVLQFHGAPFLMAYRPPSAEQAAAATNPDARAFHSAALSLEHRLVVIGAPERGALNQFDDDSVIAAAKKAMPGVAVSAALWLREYDAYYYDRHGARPLPVIRVEYDDPAHTWLYLDPLHGAVVMKQERLSRLNRWLYNGLHSLDFPFLYYRRPLWDLVVILLSIGGVVLSVTTMAPAWRRVRRQTRHLRMSVRKNLTHLAYRFEPATSRSYCQKTTTSARGFNSKE